jgi:signal transduction histidine kinase/ABC-type multidrug transport system ATPase subunit
MAADVAPPVQAGVRPLLSVQGLAAWFGPLRALDRVDLSLRPGELVALAGENGAGKTTLVRCISGDMAPGAGEILLAGRPVPADPAAALRRGVAVVWQDLALCDNLDIAANMLLGRERSRFLLSDTRQRAAAGDLLRALGIPLHDPSRSVRTLSGGQRQLLAVARAMSWKPRLLILDEPTASLGATEAAQVEGLITSLRLQGTTILLVSHDIEQMFRLADRIVVLRHGRVVGDVRPDSGHPDEVAALVSGQRVDSSARRQLTRLHGLADRLASADPSSSLSLILSALGAALGTERLCIHLLERSETLVCAASLGLPPALLAAWSRLGYGPAGGPVGLAAATAEVVVDDNVRASASWAPFRDLARAAKVRSSWAVPVLGPSGLIGVITVFRQVTGRPQRDELDLVSVYAGHAASAVERDRLLDQATARNRVLETIREMLETLAGPVPVPEGLGVALRTLRRGLQADEVALVSRSADGAPRSRAHAGSHHPGRLSQPVAGTAARALAAAHHDGRARSTDGERQLSVAFPAPGGPVVLVASWGNRLVTADAVALMEDAAHSLRLALEREAAAAAHEEAATLRRSQELQRSFLSRLSHELRTPLTAIRGYATSLLQTDVTWDAASQHRFLGRISAESARLGRLVGDLLDFSAIESGILRLQHDWCEIALVLEAAIACLPQPGASMVEVTCHPALPTVWADHDRLEQVFVNLLDNAIRHNPPGTRVSVTAEPGRDGEVMITVCDDGGGLPPELAAAPFGPKRRGHSASAGAGLGLSIAQGIVAAHAGQIRPGSTAKGTRFEIRLPVEAPGRDGGATQADSADPANAVQADSATQANGAQADSATQANGARRAGGTTRAGAATGAVGAAQAGANGKAGGVGRAPGTRRHADGGTATGKASGNTTSGNGASGNGSADDPPEGAEHHA